VEASLKVKFNEDLKLALKSGDKVKLGTIRMVLANAKRAEDTKKNKLVVAAYQKAGITDLNQLEGHPELELSAAAIAEIAKQSELNDADMMGVLAKEITQRRESIEAYKAGNRPDLVAVEEAELNVLLTYAPKQASREEIALVAKRIITEASAHGPGDKGKVMPKVIAELKGKSRRQKRSTPL